MDKNAIKKYAVWARRELIEKVSQKAMQYGIEDGKELNPNLESINDTLLTETEKKQRQALIRKVKDEGYNQVIEEVAYTWFNRFIALRFMEVNGYLPSHVRVFSDENNQFNPEIISEALHLDFKTLNQDIVYELKQDNKNDELYKYLLIAQCNELNQHIPNMFQKIADYSELLLPDYLLREGSVVEQLVTSIPENDWTDQVQIIGWMYQYYNSEPKDEVFAKLKKNIKIKRENIPAATQLFTPEWIVKYLVENSLGRYWIQSNKNYYSLSKKWNYYIESENESNTNVTEIIKPESIKVIDPCMGSGHMLVYAFEVLIDIYESAGYTQQEAAEKILQENLYGIDLDDRAGQLAEFAVLMMARKYNRRIFSKGCVTHIMAIKDSHEVSKELVDYICDGNEELGKEIQLLLNATKDAKEYGSLIRIPDINFDLLRERIKEIEEKDGDILSQIYFNETKLYFEPLLKEAEILSNKYEVVVTNPPYMGGGGMDAKLSKFVKDYYDDSKADMYAVFIEKCNEMIKKDGFQAMITQHSWMFLSSFEKLRNKVLQNEIVNMLHLGTRAFEEIGGEVVQTVAFVLAKNYGKDVKATYYRLLEGNSQNAKEEMFLRGEGKYLCAKEDFESIPGKPVAYWLSENLLKKFKHEDKISSVADTKTGMGTSDNNRFLRVWYECDYNNIKFDSNSLEDAANSKKKWFPYNKGGGFRRWYGNFEYVLNWENDGKEVKSYAAELYKSYSRTIKNIDSYFLPCMSWSDIATGLFSMRFVPKGLIFDGCSPSLYCDDRLKLYMLGFTNSIITQKVMEVLSPTIHFNSGSVLNIPFILDESKKERIEELVKECVDIAMYDWNIRETSWDFDRHPLISKEKNNLLEGLYSQFQHNQNVLFEKMKSNEIELNNIFLEIYNLKDDMTVDISDDDISVRRMDKRECVVSLISYIVGCMFGRYSVDVEGLAFAGGCWDESKYQTIKPDVDNIIPICDDEYFQDDITGKFIECIKVLYGENNLNENLLFLTDALGLKGAPREAIRKYFLNDFYKDHCAIYNATGAGKRPIYWLFDSGKKNGFKCLIYMHRYQPDTIARIRTDYVHEQQARYRTAIEETTNRIESASGSDKVKLTKKLNKLKAQNEEIHVYEEKIHHLADQMISIDLDDGVKVNYAKFQDVLAKIK